MKSREVEKLLVTSCWGRCAEFEFAGCVRMGVDMTNDEPHDCCFDKTSTLPARTLFQN